MAREPEQRRTLCKGAADNGWPLTSAWVSRTCSRCPARWPQGCWAGSSLYRDGAEVTGSPSVNPRPQTGLLGPQPGTDNFSSGAIKGPSSDKWSFPRSSLISNKEAATSQETLLQEDAPTLSFADPAPCSLWPRQPSTAGCRGACSHRDMQELPTLPVCTRNLLSSWTHPTAWSSPPSGYMSSGEDKRKPIPG